MSLNHVIGILNLFLLGYLGTVLFGMLHIPVPSLLGTIVVVGTLRVLNFPLIPSPNFLQSLLQVAIGYMVGSGVTKDKVRELKLMMAPASIIVVWSISIQFILGYTLMLFTDLDFYTAILASSLGGFPEMTLTALDVGAETSVVVVIQTVRIVTTLAILPILAKKIQTNNTDKIPIKKKYLKHFLENINMLRNFYIEMSTIKSQSLYSHIKS